MTYGTHYIAKGGISSHGNQESKEKSGEEEKEITGILFIL
jgi:hypothetical protein